MANEAPPQTDELYGDEIGRVSGHAKGPGRGTTGCDTIAPVHEPV